MGNKYKKLPLSVVIPCADDTRVSQCVESIDEKVEVVIVLNGPTKEVEELVKKHETKLLFMPERNLPAALNLGIQNSKYDRVLFMDSDCIFHKGTIRKLFEGLDKFMISKGKVTFLADSFWQKVIAKAREYTTSDRVSAYKPPLAVRKSIIKKVGYYFDSDVHWTEDADLDRRVREASLPINFIPDAIIYHPPVSLFADLRSALRYGVGKRIRVEKGISKGLGSFFPRFFDIAQRKGVLTASYLMIWSLFYTAGYLFQVFFDPYNAREKLKN